MNSPQAAKKARELNPTGINGSRVKTKRSHTLSKLSGQMEGDSTHFLETFSDWTAMDMQVIILWGELSS